MNKTIWINAGELSGDMHGALLLEALRRLDPELAFVGMGGPGMRGAGLTALYRVEDLSVMGITEVIGQLPRILRMLSGIKKDLARLRPAAVVVIDAPDFSFRVIKQARALGIPVYYYISPKVWAWRPGRANFIRDNVRRLISILPFEQEFYRRYGMDIDYVGNPLVDIVNPAALQSISPEDDLIGFLPGSRNREITALLPAFGGAAHILRRRLPGLRFACARAPGLDEATLRALWPEDVPVEFIAPEERWGFMRRCRMLIAASGTVALESAILGTPTLVTYKVSRLSFLVGRLLVKVPYISLPNLILGRQVFPELLQERCDAAPLADAALAWLLPKDGIDPLEAVRRDLGQVRGLLGEPGAADRAAGIIARDLS
jgi:lipid-A-disaccharide synthase